METYLDAIKNYNYRVSMSQLRTSSHTLAIDYLETASVLLVISSKMRDIFLSNVILIKQKEKTYSQNWHTQLQISFIWLTKKNEFSLCATKSNKYLHGLANSYMNLSKIELNTYHRYDAVCILITLPESILGVYQFAWVDACIPIQYKCIDTN